MILREHGPHYQRFGDAALLTGDVLVLGRHEGAINGVTAKGVLGAWGATSVTSLDLDGGDIAVSLDGHLAHLAQRYDTVFNLGTLEHLWDVQRAWANALRMVRVGGYFLTHSPVGGYEGHGVHVTDWRFIAHFCTLNGCTALRQWFTTQDGQDRPATQRGGGQTIYWAAFRKDFHRATIAEYARPQHVFVNGAERQVQCGE